MQGACGQAEGLTGESRKGSWLLLLLQTVQQALQNGILLRVDKCVKVIHCPGNGNVQKVPLFFLILFTFELEEIGPVEHYHG